MMNIYVIGCGGVGSWLTPSLCLLRDPAEIVLCDGDTLEEKNLNRQLFTREQIGQNKAEALAERYRCGAFADWYNPGVIRHDESDLLFALVDNNAARMSVLTACDRFKCSAIFAANETTSAEAYLFRPQWAGTRLDPRVMYPAMIEDKEGDPQRAAIGCTGQAQRENRQLVSANFMAAALAQHLFVLWFQMFPGERVVPHLPHKLVSNFSTLETFAVGNWQ